MSVVAPDAHGVAVSDRVALLGNPNTGKTTIFNSLCGVRAKTSNFPGTTTTVRIGHYRIGDQLINTMDLPGVYELSLATPEAEIARDALGGVRGPAPGAILVVIDACNLTRNLVLVGELLAYPQPMVIALNMVDLAAKRGVTIDAKKLGQRLGVTVVPTVARTGEGLDDLRTAIAAVLTTQHTPRRPADLPAQRTPEALTAWAESLFATVATHRPVRGGDAASERVDRILTHPVYGMAAFVAAMGLLFWTLFTLATIPMDLIEAIFAGLGDATRNVFPEGPVQDLVADGIVGGVAGTVVFLPQICLLFFLISLLEDTGYLARAAFVMDRLLSRFGLPGHSFVPLLTAHACAIPSIMSTRLIPNRRDRLATILIAPFMSCSARLPVYVLLTSLIFVDSPAMAALAFGACYLLGGSAALLSAVLFGRTILKGRAQPMVLELPTYKMPSLGNALLTARDQGLMFLQTAGTVIVAICIVMWWLSAYPRVEPGPDVQALRAQAEAPGLPPAEVERLTLEADTLERRAAQAGSFAGMMGSAVEPLFRPLGFDWQLTVGVLTSFLAREVFVSTMSVLVGGSGDAEADEGVIARIRSMTTADGRLVFTPATSAATLVFFVLAMQCLPTLAVTRRESGGLKYAAFQFAYMSGVAYVAALLVYQGLRAAGVA